MDAGTHGDVWTGGKAETLLVPDGPLTTKYPCACLTWRSTLLPPPISPHLRIAGRQALSDPGPRRPAPCIYISPLTTSHPDVLSHLANKSRQTTNTNTHPPTTDYYPQPQPQQQPQPCPPSLPSSSPPSSPSPSPSRRLPTCLVSRLRRLVSHSIALFRGSYTPSVPITLLCLRSRGRSWLPVAT